MIVRVRHFSEFLYFVFCILCGKFKFCVLICSACVLEILGDLDILYCILFDIQFKYVEVYYSTIYCVSTVQFCKFYKFQSKSINHKTKSQKYSKLHYRLLVD